MSATMGWLRPGETFPVNWQISDPTDTTAYFPQATVKNASTLVAYSFSPINLTTVDNKLYTGSFVVPADTSGLGFWLQINVVVYTDSAHTTASANYQSENNIYLVQDRPNRALGSGYGGGAYEGISSLSEDMKQVIQEECRALMADLADKSVGTLKESHSSLLGELSRDVCDSLEEKTKKMDEYFSGGTETLSKFLKQLDDKNKNMDVVMKEVERKWNEANKNVSLAQDMMNLRVKHFDDTLARMKFEFSGLLKKYEKIFSDVKEYADGEKKKKIAETFFIPSSSQTKKTKYEVMAESLIS